VLEKLWSSISGKKTTTAAVVLLTAVIAEKAGVDQSAVASTITSIVEWAGAGLAIIGVIHKWFKR